MNEYNIISKLVINIDNDTNYCFEIAPQGDSQSRFIDVTLIQAGGSPYVIPSGAIAILEGKNAGGYNIFNSCEVLQDYDNVIRIPLTNGVLSFGGIGIYDIGIYQQNYCIKTFPFNIAVTEAPYDIIALRASDSYEALNRLIEKASNTNKWYVGNVVPTTVEETVNNNDLYLNTSTGYIYTAQLDSSEGKLKWNPAYDQSSPPKQLNIMEKTYIRYSEYADGTNFVEIPTDNTKYIGFYIGSAASTPSDKDDYVWSKFIGDDGIDGVDGVNGNLWYRGTEISGKNTTPTIFSESEVENANSNDCYINTTEGAVYHCVAGGIPSVATWAYDFTLTGGGGGVEIDDTIISTDSVWSSQKTSSELDNKLNINNPRATGNFAMNYSDESEIGDYAFAEGYSTTASGDYSHAEGNSTIANNQNEHAEGYFNKSTKTSTSFGDAGNTQHSVGIGTSTSNRKNAFEIMQNGDAYLIGVGDYNGTNFSSSSTLQSAINNKANSSYVEGLSNRITTLESEDKLTAVELAKIRTILQATLVSADLEGTTLRLSYVGGNNE